MIPLASYYALTEDRKRATTILFMGGIYMAIIIALIVGRYMSLQVERDSESETSLKK